MEQEDRLGDLAESVHRAREAEARRRVERHRAFVGLGVVALAAVLALAVTFLSDPDEGEPTAAPAATTSAPASATTAARPEAPRTGRPATAPGTGRPAVAPTPGTTPDPASLLVLVDRQRRLPAGWAPTGMVAPQLAWASTDAVERRLLRPEAAAALDRLAADAAADGVPIIGISGFRSEESQRQVHERYVHTEGAAAARTFSAEPGHSEHQTGLAVDVTSADGACPTEPCFGAMPQAAWLVAHAHEYGFIVRYPVGKEAVTTYESEPWHLRYVGGGPAQAMQRTGLTLDEYLRAS